MNATLKQTSGLQAFRGLSGLRLAMLIALMLFIPISQAGMTPGAFAIWLITAGVLAGLSLPIELFRGKATQQKGSKTGLSWLAVWLLVTLICLTHVLFKVSISQYWIEGFRGIEVLSPELSTASTNLMSYARMQTLSAWAFFTAFWSVAYVSSRLKRKQVKWVLLAAMVMGTFEAMFGLWSLQGDGNILGLWQKIYYMADATGTFANRNHFANFLAVCLPLGLCALSGDRPLLMARYPKTYRLFLMVIFVVISVLAALASHSRMGLMVTIVAGLSWLVLTQFRKRRRLKAVDWLGLVGAVFLVALMMLWFGVTSTLNRAVTLADGDGRLLIWSSVFDLPDRVWVTGIGPGNFSEVFALVKPEDMWSFVYYAHSDYLELFLEFGLPVSIVLIIGAILWFRVNFKGNLLKDRLNVRTAAACALFVVALHSLVDFSLQIPANATYAAIALGLLLNQELSDQVKRKAVKVE